MSNYIETDLRQATVHNSPLTAQSRGVRYRQMVAISPAGRARHLFCVIDEKTMPESSEPIKINQYSSWKWIALGMVAIAILIIFWYAVNNGGNSSNDNANIQNLNTVGQNNFNVNTSVDWTELVAEAKKGKTELEFSRFTFQIPDSLIVNRSDQAVYYTFLPDLPEGPTIAFEPFDDTPANIIATIKDRLSATERILFENTESINGVNWTIIKQSTDFGIDQVFWLTGTNNTLQISYPDVRTDTSEVFEAIVGSGKKSNSAIDTIGWNTFKIAEWSKYIRYPTYLLQRENYPNQLISRDSNSAIESLIGEVVMAAFISTNGGTEEYIKSISLEFPGSFQEIGVSHAVYGDVEFVERKYQYSNNENANYDKLLLLILLPSNDSSQYLLLEARGKNNNEFSQQVLKIVETAL